MSSPCRSSKFASISWPSAGASKTLRRKTPGGRGEPEGRAVPHTHTCSFSTHNLTPSALSFCHSHTLSHTLPPLISHPISPVNFSLFALLLSHTRLPRRGETPWCLRVRRRLHIPGSLATGLRGSRPRSPKSHPSFPLISERTSRKFPGKTERETDHVNQGQLSERRERER